MIDLNRDILTFSFPAIQDRLLDAARAHIQRCWPQIAAEDRAAALDRIIRRLTADGSAPEAWAPEARRAGMALPLEAIHRRFTDEVEGALGRLPTLSLHFQRTLRIPDDGKDWPLPPGLGAFPLRRAGAYPELPAAMRAAGGVLMPMHQAEALWLSFNSNYPVALKISAGGINAVSGGGLQRGLSRDPQDYVIVPGQPWLDGFCVAPGVIRQFIAMPLGRGYTAEEQITGRADTGGVQLQVIPLRPEVWAAEQAARLPATLEPILQSLLPSLPIPPQVVTRMRGMAPPAPAAAPGAMGLGAGGRMKQQIHADPRSAAQYAPEAGMGCSVQILNSRDWLAATGEPPPLPPPAAAEYARCRLPWFDHYREVPVVAATPVLERLKSVLGIAAQKQEVIAPPEPPADPAALPVVYLGPERPTSVTGWAGER